MRVDPINQGSCSFVLLFGILSFSASWWFSPFFSYQPLSFFHLYHRADNVSLSVLSSKTSSSRMKVRYLVFFFLSNYLAWVFESLSFCIIHLKYYLIQRTSFRRDDKEVIVWHCPLTGMSWLWADYDYLHHGGLYNVLTSNYVDPRLPEVIRNRRHPFWHTTNPSRERRLLYEAFQINILRRNKIFEKGNLVRLKFDRISTLGAIANRDCSIRLERSVFCRLGMVKFLKKMSYYASISRQQRCAHTAISYVDGSKPNTYGKSGVGKSLVRVKEK